jgi:hypothetical protein
MKRRTWCLYDSPTRECEEPRDPDTKDGFCSDHSGEWRRSAEFSAALRDERVGFAYSIGLTSTAMREVNKYRKKFIHRVSKREEDE